VSPRQSESFPSTNFLFARQDTDAPNPSESDEATASPDQTNAAGVAKDTQPALPSTAGPEDDVAGVDGAEGELQAEDGAEIQTQEDSAQPNVEVAPRNAKASVAAPGTLDASDQSQSTGRSPTVSPERRAPQPRTSALRDLTKAVHAAIDDNSHDAAITAAIADEDAAAAAKATAMAMAAIDRVRKGLVQKLQAPFSRFAQQFASSKLGNSYYVTKCFCICSRYPFYGLFDGVMKDLLRLIDGKGIVQPTDSARLRRRLASKRQLMRQQQIQQNASERSGGVAGSVPAPDVDVLGNAIAEVVKDFDDDKGKGPKAGQPTAHQQPVKVPLERAIIYFMRDVALPPPNCNVEYTFRLFPGGREFKCRNPSPYSLPPVDFRMDAFFAALRKPRYVSILLACALCETKTIFVSQDTSKLGVACETLRSLLHPLNWEGPFIPVLPNKRCVLDRRMLMLPLHFTLCDDLCFAVTPVHSWVCSAPQRQSSLA